MENRIYFKKETYEEYLKIKSNTDTICEYVNGIVCMSPSQSTKHQRISGNLYFELRNYFKGKTCEVFSAPYDIQLINGNEKNLVIPDISVICNKSGFTNNKYIGVPNLIIEILSPSNQSHDLITKLGLYEKYGVKEYWIVSPKNKSIIIYSLDENGHYDIFENKTIASESISSSVFADLKINMKDIFE